jgi:hypothetical protein
MVFAPSIYKKIKGGFACVCYIHTSSVVVKGITTFVDIYVLGLNREINFAPACYFLEHMDKRIML